MCILYHQLWWGDSCTFLPGRHGFYTGVSTSVICGEKIHFYILSCMTCFSQLSHFWKCVMWWGYNRSVVRRYRHTRIHALTCTHHSTPLSLTLTHWITSHKMVLKKKLLEMWCMVRRCIHVMRDNLYISSCRHGFHSLVSERIVSGNVLCVEEM